MQGEELQQQKYGFVLYGEDDQAFMQTALWPNGDPPGHEPAPPATKKVQASSGPSAPLPASAVAAKVVAASAASPPVAADRPKTALQLRLEKKKQELIASTK